MAAGFRSALWLVGFGKLAFPPVAPHPLRTLVVRFEDRTYEVPFEDRTLMVRFEDRTYEVPYENRTLVVPKDDKTLGVSDG